jgi:membrane protein required for colicin V production
MVFNGLDFVLAAIVLAAVVVGMIKGFVREIVGLVVIVVGIVAAARFYEPPARVLGKIISNPVTARFVGFLLVFLAVLIVGGFLAGAVAKLAKGGLGFANHVLGGLVGLVEGLLLAGALVFALLIFPVSRGALGGSQLTPFVYEFTKSIVQLIPRELTDQVRGTYENITKAGADHGKEI